MSLFARLIRLFGLAIGVSTLLVYATISIGVRLRKPPIVITGNSLLGKVPQLYWSEAHVGFKYQPEITEGSDLQIIVGAEALGHGRVLIESVSPTMKVSPAPLVIEVFAPDSIETGILVASQPEPGDREILLRAKYIPESDSIQSRKPSSEADGQLIGTWPITFRVLPKTTFGLTQGQLAAIQVFSGIVGIPALLAFIFKAFIRKRSGSPSTS